MRYGIRLKGHLSMHTMHTDGKNELSLESSARLSPEEDAESELYSSIAGG